MGTKMRLYFLLFLSTLSLVSPHTYNVKIVTEQHVNLVDSRFLSFTIDPKYLFSTSEKYRSKECVCMASSLTPAYIRIAGPSTAHMSFHNTSISINDLDFDLEENDLDIVALDSDIPKKIPLETSSKKLTVTHREWRKFIHWAKSTGFDLVFALNNEERTTSSMWDPNTALNILTVAEKAKVGDIYWELGYECTNQSIEEYLNDLETLRVITETFPPGRIGDWRVVGGDVTKCLHADSKSDFKDYIALSNDMMDALLLNGNSSSYELERMSGSDRNKLLRLLYHTKTPLWLTETNQRRYNQLERAADWLASLGYSAKNGFSVHYRELEEEEMYEPTLSFYMALLFKNLVGERVLNVDMEPDQAILFGHCTSLRHKPVPGAVTLFGVNMGDEPARFSLKLSKREEGGDIMQFILGHDHSGNIVVNGRAMYYEGDIRPVVKRVRPYKTLLTNLPPKSFGFWVLANTNIEACQDVNQTKTHVEAETITESLKVKRSIEDDFEDSTHTADFHSSESFDFEDVDTFSARNEALKNRIMDINRDLNKVHGVFHDNKKRFKREDEDEQIEKKKLVRQRLRSKIDRSKFMEAKEFLSNILQKAKQSVGVLKNKGLREVRRRLSRSKINNRLKNIKVPGRHSDTLDKNPRKRTRKNKTPKLATDDTEKIKRRYTKPETPKNISTKSLKSDELFKRKDNNEEINSRKHFLENKILTEDSESIEPNIRKRREVENDTEEVSNENDIEFNEKNKAKFWKMLKRIHEDMKGFADEPTDMEDNDESQEGIVLKTQLSDDTATIKVNSGKGLIQSTMKNMISVLEDLNKNLNRFWAALSFLD